MYNHSTRNSLRVDGPRKYGFRVPCFLREATVARNRLKTTFFDAGHACVSSASYREHVLPGHVFLCITGNVLDNLRSILSIGAFAPACQSYQALLCVAFASLFSLRLPSAFNSGWPLFPLVRKRFWNSPGTNQPWSTCLVQQAAGL